MVEILSLIGVFGVALWIGSELSDWSDRREKRAKAADRLSKANARKFEAEARRIEAEGDRLWSVEIGTGRVAPLNDAMKRYAEAAPATTIYRFREPYDPKDPRLIGRAPWPESQWRRS